MDIKSGDVHRHPILPATVARIAEAQRHLKEILRRELLSTDPLIPTHFDAPHRRFQDGSCIASWYRQCIERKIHPDSPDIYNLKRYAISSLIQAKQDPKTIAAITGHRTTSLILDTYARTNQNAQEKALEAIKNLI